MESFRQHLQREFVRRLGDNPRYSLRAFAGSLKINHATLSSLLSGKRRITRATVLRISRQLGLDIRQTDSFLDDAAEGSYEVVQREAFESLVDWHYTAILELTSLAKFEFSPENIARALEIPLPRAQMAVQTLCRLGLLVQSKNGRWQQTQKNTTNILDPALTSVAAREHQKTVLRKSIEAVDSIPREKRDHTSLTVAIPSADIPALKEMIKKFRRQLDRFVQREGAVVDEVYELQVSLFPLSHIQKGES